MSQKYDRAKEILKLALTDTVSTKDFAKAFSLVLDLVKKSKEGMDKTTKNLEALYAECKSSVEERFNNINRAVKYKLDALQNGKDGKDGYDGYDGKDGKDGKDGSPDTADQVVEKINKADLLIKRSQIEGLDATFESIGKEIKKRGTLPGAIPNSRELMKVFDLSPFLDGTTKVFNVPGMWRPWQITASSAPFNFRENIDFTWTSQTITFTSQITASSTLASGQTVLLAYIST